jgi:hypothetical protein
MADSDAGRTGTGEQGSTAEYQPPCAEDLEVTGGTVEAASMVIQVSHDNGHTY